MATSSRGLRVRRRALICTLTRLPSASAQLQDFTVLLVGLHCGTWDMYPVAVPLNAHASIIPIRIHVKSHKLTVRLDVHVQYTHVHIKSYTDIQCTCMYMYMYSTYNVRHNRHYASPSE